MHTIIFGKDAEYLPDGLIARPGGQLILRDGTRYTFDVIDMPYYTCDAPNRNNNLVEIERLAYGRGKWMLGSDSFFELLADIQRKAWLQLNRDRAEQNFPPIPWDMSKTQSARSAVRSTDFQETVRESDQLWFSEQSEREATIVERINLEFFGSRYARRWGLARLLRSVGEDPSLRHKVCAAAWFEGNVTPLLLRDFTETIANAKQPSAEPPPREVRTA